MWQCRRSCNYGEQPAHLQEVGLASTASLLDASASGIALDVQCERIFQLDRLSAEGPVGTFNTTDWVDKVDKTDRAVGDENPNPASKRCVAVREPPNLREREVVFSIGKQRRRSSESKRGPKPIARVTTTWASRQSGQTFGQHAFKGSDDRHEAPEIIERTFAFAHPLTTECQQCCSLRNPSRSPQSCTEDTKTKASANETADCKPTWWCHAYNVSRCTPKKHRKSP